MSGRFEKMFTSIIVLSMVIGAFMLWSDDLFSAFGAPSLETNLSILNNTAEVSEQLQTMYNTTQNTNWYLSFNVLFAGWQVIKLIFNTLTLFLTLPLALTALLINDSVTAGFIGWSLEVIYLGMIVWAFVALFIRNEEGTV